MDMKTTLYAVTPSRGNGFPVFLTITAKKKECQAYIKKKIMLDNYRHFSSWCELHEKDADDEAVWDEYLCSDILSEEELTKYAIMTLRYRTRDLASILRACGNCVPIGVGYEKDYEYESFVNKLPKDLRKDLETLVEAEMRKEGEEGKR